MPDIACPDAVNAALALCPAHAQTPMLALDALAQDCGWRSAFAKDERNRMGLGSFKALGGAYAVFQIVRARLRETLGREPTRDEIAPKATRSDAARLTVCCASAGNHGLSVAAGARIFGAACEVFLADTVPKGFADRLRAKGAIVRPGGAVYEDAMAAAVARARDADVTLVSDASWGDEMIVPSLVMQGYAALCAEVRDSFAAMDQWPSHVAIQAGVGGLAATMAAHIRRVWPVQPVILVVEPDRAPCLAQSVQAGQPLRVDGPVSTMGRLDCKEPSLRAFQVLRDRADQFVTISDEQAQAATDQLSAHGVQTTPSGAAGLAGLIAARLDAQAIPLILLTEGAVQ